MEKNISVGLDIGTTKIVAMVGSRNEFKKFNKTKKHTKQLVAKISDAVAV